MEVIRVENLSKLYDLGQVGTGTLSKDLNRWWARVRGKQDPYARLGQTNDRTKKAEKDDAVWAIKDINFSVKQGEVIGIIGRNGAGKSTLLKIISRITTPTSGVVKVKGRIASLLEVGTGFHPEMTGRENIFMNGTLLGMTRKEIQGKLEEIIEFAGVAMYIDTPVKRYSSGMQVRLAFAVAAFLEPEILIVDEVLAVGDAEFQKKAIGRMQEVSRGDGRTVLFVSHSMAAIQSLCESVILMDKGTIHSHTSSNVAIQAYLSLNKNHANDNDLEGRIDRQGDGKIRFKGIQLLDSIRKEKINSVASGDRIIIRLLLRRQAGLKVNKLVVAIGISDMLDNRICHLSTDLTNQSFDFVPDNLEHIDVAIMQLPLNVGSYNLTIYAAVNDEVSDWVQNAYYFSVEEGDFYKTGKTIPAVAGTFLFDYKFHFQ